MPTVPRGFSGSAGGKFGIGVRNLPQVLGAIEGAGSKFDRNIKKHANRIGIILVAEGHRLIKEGYYRQAYKEGTMFRSLGAENKITSTRVDIDFGVQMHYGIYVHDGTVFMEKRPFLIDAVKNKWSEIIKELKQAFTLTGI